MTAAEKCCIVSALPPSILLIILPEAAQIPHIHTVIRMRRICRGVHRCLPAACRLKSVAPDTPKLSLTNEEIDRLVAALEKDDALLEGVVANMQAHNRRRLIVAGGALEWFGKDSVAREVERADSDNDRIISPKDFDHWFAYALKRKAEATAGSSSTNTSTPGVADPVPLAALLLIALEAGLPFVGFGFLDNATMILAGDAIDHTVGFYLNCSVMASAAMGNVVSGVMGMQVHGLVEKGVQRLNLKTPALTEAQLNGRQVFLAGHLGGTMGIMLGLTLGMLPLLFMKSEEEKSDAAAFKKWDANKNGYLDISEIVGGLKEVGVTATEAAVAEVVGKYSGGNSTLNSDQFRALCIDLRQHKPTS